jgi:hypothetical protein
MIAAAAKEFPRNGQAHADCRAVAAPSVSFVCCVESGPLETTTLLMVESLRRWGGRFATCDVTAVTPRSGPPLRRSTRAGLDKLGVRYVRRTIGTAYSWYSFLNKPLSLVTAEEFSSSEVMVWLDADVFVTGEPAAFELENGIDFAACPSDRNLGTTGNGDRFEPYWTKMCAIHGLTLAKVPWVQTCREKERIRLYFNGGVLAYRRASGYAAAYLQGCLDVLNARVRSREAGLFFAEQVTAGLIAVKQGLVAGILPERFNYAVGSKAMEGYSAENFADARVLHYHDALWGGFFGRFMEMCRAGQPALYEFLKDRGPLTNDAPLAWRLAGKVMRTLRARKQNSFEAACDAF